MKPPTLTAEEIAAATHAIAKADGWTERDIKTKAMGALQWQAYEAFAKAALEAAERAREQVP